MGFTVAQSLCHREPSVHHEQKEIRRKRLNGLIKALISQLSLVEPYTYLIRGIEGKIEKWESRL